MKILNINEIKSLATNKVTFEKGLDYYEKKKIKDFEMNVVDDEIHLKASVNGSGHNVYDVEAFIKEDGRVQATCTCEAFHTYYGSCKHIMAVLLENYYHKDELMNLITVTTKPKTDYAVTKMISSYASKGVKEAIKQTIHKKVSLVPTLEYGTNQKLYLSFTIGHVRPYVLRNLTKFYDDLLNGEIVEYGKSLTLLHDLDSFNEESQPLVKFFMNCYNEYLYYQQNQSNYYSYNYGYDGRFLLLSPSQLDEFFNLYENKTISFNYHKTESKVTFVHEKPSITLSITEENEDVFSLTVDTKYQLMFKGKEYSYLYIKGFIYRIDDEFEERVGLLLHTFKEKKDQLQITKEDMRAFCGNVLNQIKDDVTLDVKEGLLADYEPIPLVSKLYIDMPEKNRITAKLIFLYGDVEYEAFNEAVKSERNLRDELIAKHMMNKYFEFYSKDLNAYVMTDNQSIYQLYDTGLNELSNYMDIYATDQFKHLFKEPPVINVALKMNHHLLDIDINLPDFPVEELFDVLDSYKHDKKYHRLSDGSFVQLEKNSLTELLDIVEGLDLKKKDLENNNIQVPKYRALFLDQILKNSELIHSERDTYFKSLVRDIKDVDDTAFNLPNYLKSTLRNYQKTGFRWLKTLSHYGFGGILADDMGLGKTLQVLTVLYTYKEENEMRKPSLVVSPASLVLNWDNEVQKFAPELKTLIIIGTQDVRKEIINTINDYDLVITSYDYLKRDYELYENTEFMYHIIDEAQFIKNHSTLNAKSVKQIKSEVRFALTGTPIENNLAEIWSIFDFIMPGYLYTYRKFSQNFEAPITKNDDSNALEQLKRLVTPFVLRRLKKDVLKELPDKTETIVYVSLKDEQLKLYLANLLLAKNQVSDKIRDKGFNQSKIMILALLMRLRQICCHPSLYYQDYNEESAKLEACLELVETSIESGHKILLFSQFTSMLDLIKKHFEERKISHYMLTGATKKEDRRRLVDSFNQDDTSVFLISLKAGGTGLNLTGADVVIHYDPWWNLSAENQATDRTHRIGQKNNVQVYKLIAKDTIEEKILKLQENKQHLAESIIVKDDGIITKMTQEEILKLFD